MNAIVMRSEPNQTALSTSSSAPQSYTLEGVLALSKTLANAKGFLPETLKTEGEIAAVILTGLELGLPPMVTLRSLHMVKGKVVIDAALQLGLMMARAGCRVEWLADGTDGKVARLKLERPGQKPFESVYTVEMAKQAGLMGNSNWQKNPAAMLRARAASAAGKAYCPDVMAGIYDPSELEDLLQQQSVERIRDIAVANTQPAPAPAPTRTAVQDDFDTIMDSLVTCKEMSAHEFLAVRARGMWQFLNAQQRKDVTAAIHAAKTRIEQALADEAEREQAEEALRAQESAEQGEAAADAQAGAA
jgi:hypothetical protein